jgi:hypothetical protein
LRVSSSLSLLSSPPYQTAPVFGKQKNTVFLSFFLPSTALQPLKTFLLLANSLKQKKKRKKNELSVLFVCRDQNPVAAEQGCCFLARLASGLFRGSFLEEFSVRRGLVAVARRSNAA